MKSIYIVNKIFICYTFNKYETNPSINPNCLLRARKAIQPIPTLAKCQTTIPAALWTTVRPINSHNARRKGA